MLLYKIEELTSVLYYHRGSSSAPRGTRKIHTTLMSEAETFIQHPLRLDPTSKAISTTSTDTPDVVAELESLNLLHRALLTLDSPNAPPPPRPVNPNRSAQITKLRDTANVSYRKSAFAEAVKLYGYAIDMAL